VNLRLAFLLFILVAIGDGVSAQSATSASGDVRVQYKINDSWNYTPSTAKNPSELAKGKNDWNAVSIPHTWNQWDVVDPIPGYRRSAGWYSRPLSLKPQAGKRHHLYFEGANMTSDVFVNGKRAGGHVGGYVGFSVDITDYLAPDGKNAINVRVDNGYNPDLIPSQKADFFIYGGLTRDVWLRTVNNVHLDQVAVSTPTVSAASAQLTATIELAGVDQLDRPKQGKLKVWTRLRDAKGQVVSEQTTTDFKPNEAWEISMPEIKNPKLWSPSAPNLYTLETGLYLGENLLDFKTETVGFRWFRFDDYGAFYLNGERLLLRGTHRHEEHAGLGAAMPDSMHYADIQQMKDMGVNFLRLGHYPQDPEVYKACNELGIIVWDELPWCRGGMGEEVWQSNTMRLLEEQITQNYNHPSILFWSLGNEIYWLPDFPGGDDEEKVKGFLRKLNDKAHELDPQRMTAIRKYYAGSDLVDVFSPSIWSGWYAGVFTNYEATLDKNQKLYKRFLHMEYGGSSHVGRHTEEPITSVDGVEDANWAEVSNQVDVKNMAKDGDWTESYIVDLFDHYLSVTETREGFAGNAQWAFKDFGTPLRPENAIPYMNQKGLVDRAGKPKDAYYVFKSYWSDDPFAYIESHTWTERAGPKGVPREVAVYSNMDSIELSLNGTSLGWRTRTLGKLPAGGLAWDVPFVEGKNTLVARGPKGVSDQIEVNYSYSPAKTANRIELAASKMATGNILIVATAVDKNGQRVLNYEKPMYFDLNGTGELLVNYGTPTRSQIIQMANGRAAIELVPTPTGTCTIEARNQDFKGSYLNLDFSKAAGKPTGFQLGNTSTR
jgi:beta-galactosidase